MTSTATRFPKAGVLSDIFSLAVNKQQSVADLLAEQFQYFAALSEEIGALQKSYTARKIAANAMDFDDLLALWLRLLQEQPRNPRKNSSAVSNSSWWTNIRTPTNSKAR